MIRTLPRHAVQVKRVPEAIETGAALAYYDLGSLDGSRPGIFYLNLNPDLQCTVWQLPTLAYHEAVPGHHLHASIQQESGRLPLIRKTTWFGAFNEGWSLYAEQLADEAGAYEGKPLARIGYLSYALLRAARLVVDTGLHAQRWSRERAIEYLRPRWDHLKVTPLVKLIATAQARDRLAVIWLGNRHCCDYERLRAHASVIGSIFGTFMIASWPAGRYR